MTARRIALVIAAFLVAYLAAQMPVLPGCAAVGAPVPKPAAPKELTNADVLGDWKMMWGNTPGTASLGTNGEYYEVYGTSHYIGYWFINAGGELVIVERWFNPETGAVGGEMTFKFKPTAMRAGYFRAECGGIVLELTK
jgi:hypothetical protein